MFVNFDVAAKLVQLCSLAVVLVVATVTTVLGLQQTPETGCGRSFIASSFRSEITTQYPYLVGLISGEIDDITDRQTDICTGTLLSPVLILSSAYCTSRLTAVIKENPEVTKLFVSDDKSNK